MKKIDGMANRNGRMIKEDDTIINEADILDQGLRIGGAPASGANPVPIAPSVLTQAPVVNALTVPASTQVEVIAGEAALAGRRRLILYPPSDGTIYWGPTGVTAVTGAPLASTGSPVTFNFDPDIAIPIYVIGDGTQRTCRVVEVK